MEAAMSVNPVIWFEIYVQDIDRAKKFYESVLQRTLQPLSAPLPELKMWSFPMDQNGLGAAGALVQMQGAPSGPGGTLIYFHSEDCAIEEARVTQFGGRIQRPKMSIGEYGFITLAFDTEGNMFGLHSMK
jgi:hypothetical protein